MKTNKNKKVRTPKVIQIAVTPRLDASASKIYALLDNGTIFAKECPTSEDHSYPWVSVPLPAELPYTSTEYSRRQTMRKAAAAFQA